MHPYILLRKGADITATSFSFVIRLLYFVLITEAEIILPG